MGLIHNLNIPLITALLLFCFFFSFSLKRLKVPSHFFFFPFFSFFFVCFLFPSLLSLVIAVLCAGQAGNEKFSNH